MTFTPDEIDRYARQLVLPGIGGPGQQRLKRASLLVVGAGGLGAPVLAYCAAAGIGRIGIADHDVVGLSNLQRQVIYRTSDLGRPKAERAAAAVAALNPHVAVEPIAVRVTEANAVDLVAGYDIVADCTDNADARYVVSDACFRARRPLVTASVVRLDGTVTTLKPYETGADGVLNPTYRCLFPAPPADGAAPVCAELGVLGAVAGIVGSIQATEVIKEITGAGSGLVRRLLLVDGRDMRLDHIAYAWNPENPLTGSGSRLNLPPEGRSNRPFAGSGGGLDLLDLEP